MELGLTTFVEYTDTLQGPDKVTPQQRIANLLEEIKLADEVGLEVFGIGEHHRPDFLASAPAVLLGAAAAITKNIRLASAVTVLSSDDPVRVYQDFATVDLLSNGRAEIMAGRGSFIESFPLFGYDLNDYDTLFEDKLELLLQIRDQVKVNWKGSRHRAAIKDLGVYPRSVQEPLPVWVAVGGTPQSIARAAKLGLPLTLAIIGGYPNQFAQHMRLYHDIWKQSGHSNESFQLAINSHGYVAEDSQTAAKEFWPSYSLLMSRIGRERGWPPMTEAQFNAMRDSRGSLLVGSPAEVVDKILYEHELFGNTRFLIQMSVGTMPHRLLMKGLELFGTKVAPEVRQALKKD